jgi:hypothetical protein
MVAQMAGQPKEHRHCQQCAVCRTRPRVHRAHAQEPVRASIGTTADQHHAPPRHGARQRHGRDRGLQRQEPAGAIEPDCHGDDRPQAIAHAWGNLETPNAQATEGASARAVAAATEAIFGKHGVAIAVPERRFRIEGGCLLDAGDLAPPPKSPPPPPDLMRQAIYGAFAFFLEQTKDEKVDFNEYYLLVLKSYVTAISIPISTAEPIVAMARLADLPKGWEQWAVSAIVDELFRMVHDQIYKK